MLLQTPVPWADLKVCSYKPAKADLKVRLYEREMAGRAA
jgi:hypothetical protein